MLYLLSLALEDGGAAEDSCLPSCEANPLCPQPEANRPPPRCFWAGLWPCPLEQQAEATPPCPLLRFGSWQKAMGSLEHGPEGGPLVWALEGR